MTKCAECGDQLDSSIKLPTVMSVLYRPDLCRGCFVGGPKAERRIVKANQATGDSHKQKEIAL